MSTKRKMLSDGSQFPNNLVAIMKRKQMPVVELAILCKVTPDTITSWRIGYTRPKPHIMSLVATILNVQAEDIWPDEIAIGHDWELEHQRVTEMIGLLHYRDDYKQYQELCSKRAALSVKVHAPFSRIKSGSDLNSVSEGRKYSPYQYD